MSFVLLEVSWHEPQTSIVILMQLSYAVLRMKDVTCNVRNSTYKIFYRYVSFLTCRLNVSVESMESTIILRIDKNFVCIQ